MSTPSAAYLSLELVDGGDLLSPIERRGAYPESHARALFAQVVEAVDHMHTHSVVHRDLKPENICFTAGGEAQIKIIDLGAAGYDSGEGLCDLCGTALYAAPEMVPWFHVHDLDSANRCPRYGREVRRPPPLARSWPRPLQTTSQPPRLTTGPWASLCT